MTDVIEGTSQLEQSWAPPQDRRQRPPRRVGKVVTSPIGMLVAGLVTGVVFDLAVRQSRVGVGTALWCLAVVFGLLLVARHRRASTVVWFASLAFVPWYALRSSPWLLVPNTLAFVALAGYGADLAAGGPVRRSVSGLCRVAMSALGAVFEMPSVFVRAISLWLDGVTGKRRGTLRRVGRSLAIAMPVVVALFALLMSGDALFAATFNVNAGQTMSHVMLTAFGLLLFATMLTMATGPSRVAAVVRPARLRSLDAAMLLGGVSVLFVAYATVQLSGFIHGARYIERQTGLTYAEYARSGFFQLMGAATISFVLLCVVRPTIHEAILRRRMMRWLVMSVVLLTQVLVVGSIIRLRLYSDVFGLTHLRLYTVVSAGWLGLVVILAGAAALRRGRGDWMAVTASALAALAIFGMNLVNPDRLVAQENIGRVDYSTARFDGTYLALLSSDAVPWIVDHIGEVPADQRDQLVTALCTVSYKRDGWLSYNASDAAAEDALAELCT